MSSPQFYERGESYMNELLGQRQRDTMKSGLCTICLSCFFFFINRYFFFFFFGLWDGTWCFPIVELHWRKESYRFLFLLDRTMHVWRAVNRFKQRGSSRHISSTFHDIPSSQVSFSWLRDCETYDWEAECVRVASNRVQKTNPCSFKFLITN